MIQLQIKLEKMAVITYFQGNKKQTMYRLSYLDVSN